MQQYLIATKLRNYVRSKLCNHKMLADPSLVHDTLQHSLDEEEEVDAANDSCHLPDVSVVMLARLVRHFKTLKASLTTSTMQRIDE